jgi:hypothetical protein
MQAQLTFFYVRGFLYPEDGGGTFLRNVGFYTVKTDKSERFANQNIGINFVTTLTIP